mmetsp:Transcript_29538/g.65405  ORF Transcript_29538/g.65405 Transcript_29538/m.65405 type:complete len:400 (+) Transcript_29538:305-1504(+)|eukprot:CAMPEP_0202892276 /NCGR_PEP_ID=MMETSP1392-20130828/2023_1 /ASSEMBLY_ACC=CAM_ASM_000868 /TAXON_ID=225041 /ORGANISM="Chlamydomonas chlamydogama, Strain SAG 11-48b" /LENGTH=399 /DNA_ID=CAMNT_0049576171 /DNA_START=305 /DNA_END=1504 /DNA_ORIENTATION=+
MPVQASKDADPLAGHPKYRKQQALSAGAFGFVQLCENIFTKEQVAIKFIERGDRVTKYVEAEVINHRTLRHPHVIEFKEVFLTQDHICIAMEYASGGNLFSYVTRAVRLKEPAARWFFQQLIIGLDYCHKRGVVNRDIKLENTLLQNVPGLPLPLLKICDFGYSKAQFMSAPKSKVGTLAYMAPEVIRVTTGQYDGKLADLWSCGVMLYIMLFGQYPFESPGQGNANNTHRVQTMMQRILNMQWSIPGDVHITDSCRDLLTRLLVADPARRLKMSEIQKHPWFLDNLPPDALSMNDTCLTSTDYTGVQPVEEIQSIVRAAQTPGPGKYNFNTGEEEGFEEMIDDAIQNEMVAHHSSFDLAKQTPGQHAGQHYHHQPPQQQQYHHAQQYQHAVQQYAHQL